MTHEYKAGEWVAVQVAGDLMQDEVKKSAVAEADLPASKTYLTSKE